MTTKKRSIVKRRRKPIKSTVGGTGLVTKRIFSRKSILLILILAAVAGIFMYRSQAAVVAWNPDSTAVDANLNVMKKRDGSAYWYVRQASKTLVREAGTAPSYSTIGQLTLNDPTQGAGTYCATVQTFYIPGGVRFTGANAQLPSAQIPAGRYEFAENITSEACVTADLAVGPLTIILERRNVDSSKNGDQTFIVQKLFKKENVIEADKKCAGLVSLKFCDDFDGSAGVAPDSAKWHVFSNGSSWGSQCWSNKPENIATDGNGNLKISLIDTKTNQCKNSYGDQSTITSGGMDTQGKFTTKYGKFEIRAKLACAKSVWGAFWLSTGTGPGWPQSGEVDIYEIGYDKQNVLQQTIHAGKSSSDKYSIETYATQTNPYCSAFHVYGVEWREGYIQFFLDGKPTKRLTVADGQADAIASGKTPYWPFDSYDLRLLIDLQYGKAGTWTGAPDSSQLPSSMLIDYVRIYN